MCSASCRALSSDRPEQLSTVSVTVIISNGDLKQLRNLTVSLKSVEPALFFAARFSAWRMAVQYAAAMGESSAMIARKFSICSAVVAIVAVEAIRGAVEN